MSPMDLLPWTRISKKFEKISCHVITSIISAGLVPEGMFCASFLIMRQILTLCRLIAIMLGRLRMSVDDCIDEYLRLGGRVFGKPRHFHQLVKPLIWVDRTKYDAKIFEDVIQDVTERRGKIGGGSRFKSEPGLCKTCVSPFADSHMQANIGLVVSSRIETSPIIRKETFPWNRRAFLQLLSRTVLIAAIGCTSSVLMTIGRNSKKTKHLSIQEILAKLHLAISGKSHARQVRLRLSLILL